MANLRAAFPEKAETEIRAIARGAWDNLGRTAAESAPQGMLFDYDYANPRPRAASRSRASTISSP